MNAASDLPALYIANQRYSSWSLRAWLMARKSGVPFTTRWVSLLHPAANPELQQLPAQRVPVWVTETGLPIWDSLAILEYLAEIRPELIPADSEARAICRSVCAEMHSGFQALRGQRPMNLGWLGSEQRPVVSTPALQQDIDRICAIWTHCLGQYANGPGWLFGQFSMADAMYAPVVLRFAIHDIPATGVVAGYIRHWLADPDLQQWIRDAQAGAERIPRYEVYPD